jgi:probable rRNA maturation factor
MLMTPIQTDLLIEDPRWEALHLADLLHNALGAVWGHLELPEGYCVSVLACDDVRIAGLNEDFRDKPTPTNVLSWPSEERGAAQDGQQPERLNMPAEHEAELGDIAIAYDTCVREAVEAGKPVDAHVTHLLVHGLLHLLGYDHIRDKDAALMEGLETAILARLGIADPYLCGS